MKRMILTVLACVLPIAICPVHAQSIDELPGPVYEVAADFEQHCRKWGGTPDYNPLELVKLVYFGKDWDHGGRESYVIDLSKMRCPGGDLGPGNDRADCNGKACILVVMNPSGAEGFRVDFNDRVLGWRLAGKNAASGGPDVDIIIRTKAGEQRYGITAAGFTRK